MSFQFRRSREVLRALNFRDVDVYEKVNKAKIFNDKTLSKNMVLFAQIQGVKTKTQVNSIKVKAYAEELTELFHDLQLDDLFTSRPFKSFRFEITCKLIRDHYNNIK